jgi:hypothetical protein
MPLITSRISSYQCTCHRSHPLPDALAQRHGPFHLRHGADRQIGISIGQKRSAAAALTSPRSDMDMRATPSVERRLLAKVAVNRSGRVHSGCRRAGALLKENQLLRVRSRRSPAQLHPKRMVFCWCRNGIRCFLLPLKDCDIATIAMLLRLLHQRSGVAEVFCGE